MMRALVTDPPWPRGGCVLVLEAVGLYKRFGGRLVVENVSIRIRRGEVYALVGPNGAGKTTTLRMIVGVYKPTRGFVRVCGRDVHRDPRARSMLAYLPESAGVYPRLTGYEHLRFYAGLYAPDRVEEVVREAARISGLGEALGRRVSEYSRGMRQRLLLSVVLALGTPLVVLDEPTSGLDVYSAVEVRRLIRRAASEGRAVLMTSHNMLEVERVADRVGFMARGRIVVEGAPKKLLEMFGASDLEEAFVKAVGERGRVE